MNQLTGIVYPDEGLYSFEYANNNALLTAKTEPNGNRFEHYFDDEGRVTATNNQEGGLWQFERAVNSFGEITSTVRTPNTTRTINTNSRDNGREENFVELPYGEVRGFEIKGVRVKLNCQSFFIRHRR